MVSDDLDFTGERFTPECVREIRYEHFHRYAFAAELVKGRKVLDAACGEGYGAALLAGAASSVRGVDVSGQAIEHARLRYRAQNLDFLEVDCLDLPFADDEFDCIVSFETLEHLEEQESLLQEFRRVLKPEGFLLISTPDKAVYSDQQNSQNEFHVKELYRDEFESLLRGIFPACRLWGQKLMFQSAIWSLQPLPGVSIHQEKEGKTVRVPMPRHEAVYLIALCTADEAFLPTVDYGLSLFDDAAESVYSHYHHEIRKNMSAGELLAEKDKELAKLQSSLSAGRPRTAWLRRLFGR